MTARVADADRPAAVGVNRQRRLGLRHLWLVPGIGIAVLAGAQATQNDLGLAPLLVFGIVPHLTVLVGIGQRRARGQLAARAVPLFNALHHPALPVAMIAVAAAGLLTPFWLAGALAWLGHIVVDWAFGDGLRTADGWRRHWTDIRFSSRPSGREASMG